jgi:hypothetical protein
MASLNKFNSFVEAAMEKVHNLGSDSLKVALLNAAHPPSASNTKLSDLTEISYTNLSSRALTVSSSVQTSGTYKLVIADLVLTATGGTVGPFQYIVLYNDTATNNELIGWYDYGAQVSIADGVSFTLDFDGTNGVFQLA